MKYNNISIDNLSSKAYDLKCRNITKYDDISRNVEDDLNLTFKGGNINGNDETFWVCWVYSGH